MEILFEDQVWYKVPFSSAIDYNLQGSPWRFGRLNGQIISKYLWLLNDGRIGGHINTGESSWEGTNTSLTFFNENGIYTTRFDICYMNSLGNLLLVGKFRFGTDDGSLHFLYPTTEPLQMAQFANNFRLDRHFEGPKRRNLVILGANESSLHTSWVRDIDNADRNWDLFISFYGSSDNYHEIEQAEYSSLQTGMRKWLAIHRAMYNNSPLWDYERIFIIDDDIMTRWSDINYFFELCRTFDLSLAQPALAHGCNINHALTEQDDSCILRFTTFVEAMAPCFTREALKICIPCTQMGYYGFGIDHLWPLLLGFPKTKIGIIDAVSINHTRPFGSTYSLQDAIDEERELLSIYGIPGVLGLHETGRLMKAYESNKI